MTTVFFKICSQLSPGGNGKTKPHHPKFHSSDSVLQVEENTGHRNSIPCPHSNLCATSFLPNKVLKLQTVIMIFSVHVGLSETI